MMPVARSAVVATALLGVLTACDGRPAAAGDVLRSSAHVLASGVHHAVSRAALIEAPYRCARSTRAGGDAIEIDLGTVAGKLINRTGDRLKITSNNLRPSPSVSIGVIADLRGAGVSRLAALGRLRDSMFEAKVDVVLVLGGMAGTLDDLQIQLETLTEGNDWIVVAMPGDREHVDGLRGAIRELSNRGKSVFDGSDIRLIALDHVVIGTLPGVSHPSRLIAGSDGCQYDEADAHELATRLAAADGVRVFASYAAPRQETATASDLTNNGIHAGELILSEAVTTSRAALVVHGQLEDSIEVVSGAGKADSGQPVSLATGSADPVPNRTRGGKTARSTALIARFDGQRLRWQRISGEGRRSAPLPK